ncbi:hypothetical protein BC834DRAFT_1039339 [Gloeopeniophorella convolvens]|nr:hypothetical protein BC834DRAFT_1039339 [Gloeopeniophorella convolvens]
MYKGLLQLHLLLSDQRTFVCPSLFIAIMFDSKLFIAFLATLGAVGGASATALERRATCGFGVPGLISTGTIDCCTSITTLGTIPIVNVTIGLGANCTVATGSTCPPPRTAGPACCIPSGAQAAALCRL